MYDIRFVLEDLKSDRKKKLILDTDTYNEVDDQYALAHMMQSPDKVSLLGVCAAPYFNWRSESYADGAEKSYGEILKIMSLVDPDAGIPAFRGSSDILPDTKTPVHSPAAEFIVKTANEIKDEPLYILGIGASTNIASAILLDPSIKEKIVIVWLGGNETHIGFNNGEFNLAQDVNAAKVLFESDVTLVQYPASNVTSHLWIHSHIVEQNLIEGNNALCDYLYEEWMELKGENEVYGRCIWDIGGSACFTVPEAAEMVITKKPSINDDEQKTFNLENAKYEMIYVQKLNPPLIFDDVFKRIKAIKRR